MVLIFGKESCPYTQAAIEEYTDRGVEHQYVDVKARREDLDRMLVYSKGQRRVPVIVDGDRVQIGFGGT